MWGSVLPLPPCKDSNGGLCPKTDPKATRPERALWEQSGEGDSQDPAMLFCLYYSSNGEQNPCPVPKGHHQTDRLPKDRRKAPTIPVSRAA